jgi:hypothetical protein
MDLQAYQLLHKLVANCFATVTNWFPGPKNLVYFWNWFPKVIPAIAWIPPTFKILVTPHKLAANNIAGFTFPSLSGGTQRFRYNRLY